ncbi:SbcC/MukB-like Walker B domain-containing protein [Lentzea kentuckyensis]|uniref:SbcC/MukB-like Walker B domain-containing protein n=1 Tax=Lentzea kentuckyensis TaxID=360086 RepID=UPI001B8037B3|nr:SbcC/MukB-like Walker B domain-containing protein [Lentzea kentuckyensis]
MSDLKLFRITAGRAKELAGGSVALERHLQRTIESNMETLFGVTFLESEFSTGPHHRGRIVSIGIDETGSPVVASDGTEERLTQARHSTLSGGERSVSLHLPLFAAAHVLLSSAAEHAPRLLALDEAFVGVDDKGRSELLQLTAQFDLDLFMTGYDLWATYATVPACAHYDLSHSAAEHTVSACWSGGTAVRSSPTTRPGTSPPSWVRREYAVVSLKERTSSRDHSGRSAGRPGVATDPRCGPAARSNVTAVS